MNQRSHSVTIHTAGAIHRFNQRGKASVLLGGQFGSEGKGLAAAYAARWSKPSIAVTNAAPNAGHTTIMEDGRKFVTFHMPTAGVVHEDIPIYLNAGAVIDPPKLFEEMESLGIGAYRVAIHPRAAVVTDEDKAYEAGESGARRIASTQKGIGRAIARKAMREGVLAGDVPELKDMIRTVNLNSAMMNGESVMIEVPQGAGLALNSGLDPRACTSREVSVMQAMSDAGVHPSFLGNVMMVLRTFPIRVGHIVGEDGAVIGNSGPCFPDQTELTFETVGVPPEYTTVTKRMRRIFSFSGQQYAAALSLNRPNFVFLNFVNYLKGWESYHDLCEKMRSSERTAMGSQARIDFLFGFGPSISDVAVADDDAVQSRMGWADR